MAKKEFERLPKTVKPISYDLHLHPNLETFKFAGNVKILVDVLEPISEIKMNAAELEFTNAKIGEQGASCAPDSETETVTIKTTAPLKVGKHTIEINFVGIHNDDMKGFYRTKSTNKDGVDEYSLVTQFEATDARRALPCWDEPSWKATFKVRLTVPEKKTALSNMDVVGATKNENATITYEYSETPIMSTYLLAFCVGEYDYVEGKTKSGILVRIYTEKGVSHQGNFALECGIKCLDFYEDYFQIKYPLPKCDMIAVADFAAGAMENWGLITYRSVCILFDEEKSTLRTKERVGIVVAHELAHQWFGNLVTMEWWTHLWLNEGFATFMEYLAIDNCYPEWRIFDEFIGSTFYRALDLDGLDSSHAIEVPVGHPSEIDEIFDTISYCKGASVIRMLYEWIGDAAFRKGMKQYLTKFSYKNAFTEDLWESLSEASGLPVGDVMAGWTGRLGFPLVSAKVKSWDDNSLVVTLSQKKFSATNGAVDAECWKIPISFIKSSDSKTEQVLMTSASIDVEIKNLPKDGWVKFNAGATGFYQVHYDEQLFNAIKPHVKSLTPRDRVQVEADLYAACKAGIEKSSRFLDLARCYKGEMDFNVWNDFSSSLASYRNLAESLGCKEEAKKLLREIYSQTASAIGFEKNEKDSHSTGNLRSLVWGQLAKCDHEELNLYAAEHFKKMVEDPTSTHLNPDMQGVVLTTAARQQKTLDDLIKLHSGFPMQEQKSRTEIAIGSVQGEELMAKAIDYAFSDAVRQQDMTSLLGTISASSLEGREAIWAMLQNKWSFWQNFKGSFMVGRMLNNAIARFDTAEKADEIEKYFNDNPIETARRAVSQALETVRLKAKWLERDGDDIRQFLSQYKQ